MSNSSVCVSGIIPGSALSLRTNELLLLVFFSVHAAAAALLSDVLFVVYCLILLAAECQQQLDLHHQHGCL